MTAPITENLNHLATVLADAVIDDREAGVYRTNRRIFTDEEIFELEMKHIFEGNWIYLAHESQLPNPGDYFTTYIGRQPVVITRDKNGELHCLINACAHRGAMVCRRKTDNRMTLTCPFHGWTFRNDGTLLKVKDPDGAGYPATFNVNGSHNMTKVARFDGYRGFLFGSLNPDVVSLEEHLGDTTKVIDMLVDQSPEGLEVLRGSSTYTYDGNWKVQAENGADGYHVTATHWNYAATTSRRSTGESKNEAKVLDAGSWGKSGGGYWSYPNGHLCLWTWAANPQDRPLWDKIDELKQTVRRGQGRVHGQGLAQPVPVPERLPDGPVLHADPAFPPDRAGQDRGHHLLHRTQGREPRGPGASDPAVRGLLQRLRHGHPRRPGGVPVLPAHLPGVGRAVERHEPRRRALADRPGPGRRIAWHARCHLGGRQERRRGAVSGPARLLARDHAGRNRPRDHQRDGEVTI